MTPVQQQEAAQGLRHALDTSRWIEPLRETFPDISGDDAYAIQQINIAQRLSTGGRIVGRKIGLTSRSVQLQLGVNQPDFGTLIDDMAFGDGESIPLSALQQPRIEAEIAFVLAKDLSMTKPSTVEVINAVAYALPALEIVGSRIQGWNIRYVDTVADNASSSAFVLGTTPRSLYDFDVRLCGMVMTRRGEPVSTGAGASCLGNPINALTWLAKTMVRLGSPLKAGDVVLSGALGAMVAVQPGDVFEARIQGLGSVRAVFEKEDTQ